jgi:hypothetical protein
MSPEVRRIAAARVARSLAAAVAALAVGAPVLAQVYSSGGINQEIPDPGSTTSTIHVAGGPASVASLRVVVLVRHPWDADVGMALVRGNTYLRLAADNGGGGQNYYLTRFADDAATSVSAGAAPFVGNFRAQGGALVASPFATDPLPPNAAANLAAFNGPGADGDWTLWVEDDDVFLGGSLRYWSLEFNGAHDPNGDPIPPAVFTDLGTVNDAQVGTVAHLLSMNPAQVRFFKLVVPVSVAAPLYMDLDTVGSALAVNEFGLADDTMVYLFDNNGTPLVSNDDGGPGATSLLSFGAGSGQSIGDADDLGGGVSSGMNGDLPAGTYWLAVAGYQMAADSGWVVESTSSVGGTVDVRLRTNIHLGPTCGTGDFNNDGDSSTDADIEAFFACIAGNCCAACQSSDFDGDGDSSTDADIEAFFRVLAGGNC